MGNNKQNPKRTSRGKGTSSKSAPFVNLPKSSSTHFEDLRQLIETYIIEEKHKEESLFKRTLDELCFNEDQLINRTTLQILYLQEKIKKKSYIERKFLHREAITLVIAEEYNEDTLSDMQTIIRLLNDEALINDAFKNERLIDEIVNLVVTYSNLEVIKLIKLGPLPSEAQPEPLPSEAQPEPLCKEEMLQVFHSSKEEMYLILSSNDNSRIKIIRTKRLLVKISAELLLVKKSISDNNDIDSSLHTNIIKHEMLYDIAVIEKIILETKQALNAMKNILSLSLDAQRYIEQQIQQIQYKLHLLETSINTFCEEINKNKLSE